ncbi:MAG: M1 family aminopeptidase [Lishizhenia sp.]
MKIAIVFISTFLLFSCATTQKLNENKPATNTIAKEEKEVSEQPIYRASEKILTDLIHTKLEVRFDWEKAHLLGKATLTAKPYFFATDSLILDAKGMEIHTVMMNEYPLNYSYTDGAFLRIALDTVYTLRDTFKVEITYTAKPNDRKEGGSAAITSDKGLYFINPLGADSTKMPQIWTQGETEASSVWFPTIDAPNQKMTQEILMTVQNKYITLSNGKLIKQIDHADGTRTDHWKQDLPHVPYLAMMAVGEFKKVEDNFTKEDGSSIAVDYYVEPEWESSARAIFGTTPEMIGFFSDLLGVEYPWDKYAQIIVRDYVSGAMENTGAVIFGDYAYKTERELLDANDQSTIAHELFHHWFGDLVTCESWANLPLNESFANYAQYLWDEYKYGEQEADYNALIEKQGYYASAQSRGHHNLIWLDYPEKEAMFDGHSYNKGGRILHMLRNYLGDEAFFASAKLYLEQNQFQPAEIHHLRLAFEKVSGEDLNWFFNQWFFASNHPTIKVEQEVKNNALILTVKQLQDLEKVPLYRLPTKIAVYTSNGKEEINVEINKSEQIIRHQLKGSLLNVIFDADRVLLGEIIHQQPEEQYIHQFYNAPKYADKLEAISKASKLKTLQSSQLILDAMQDAFWAIRLEALNKANFVSQQKREDLHERVKVMAASDPNSKVRARAITFLASDFEKEDKTKAVIVQALQNDLSYKVLGNALLALGKIDKETTLQLADSLQQDQSSSLVANIGYVYFKYGDTSHLPFMLHSLKQNRVKSYDAISMLGSFTNLLVQQEAKIIEKYLPSLEQLSGSGSAYIKMMLPINLRGMETQLIRKIDKLNREYDKEMEAKNVAIADQIKRKKNALEITSKKVNSLNHKLKQF